MQLFLDTASIDDIERLKPLGLVQGVTTNPALLAREGGSALQQLEAIAARVEGPVSAQVTQDGAKEMIAQGRALADVAPNVIVKVPAHAAGLEAARALSERGVDCNVTLAFDAAQAIPFATVPVAYVSLILGRVEDFGLPSGERVRSAARLLERIGSRTKLLVASLRTPAHLRVAGLDGLRGPRHLQRGHRAGHLHLRRRVPRSGQRRRVYADLCRGGLGLRSLWEL